MVLLFGQLATMCPKPKHLKHFVLEVLVGDLVLEGEVFLEVCGVDFWKDYLVLKIYFYPQR